MGMSTAITFAFSDTTSVNVGCVDTWTSPLGSSETATQPFRYPSTPATSTLVSGRDAGEGGCAAVASRNPSTTSRASATFIASGLSTGTVATVSPSAPLIVTVPLFVPSGARWNSSVSSSRASNRACLIGSSSSSLMPRRLTPFAPQPLHLGLVGRELLGMDVVQRGRVLSRGTITIPFGRSWTSASPASAPPIFSRQSSSAAAASAGTAGNDSPSRTGSTVAITGGLSRVSTTTAAGPRSITSASRS